MNAGDREAKQQGVCRVEGMGSTGVIPIVLAGVLLTRRRVAIPSMPVPPITKSASQTTHKGEVPKAHRPRKSRKEVGGRGQVVTERHPSWGARQTAELDERQRRDLPAKMS